ncbi:hypothetical protein CTEN210_17160 [Chaetoceros tenuissimus]|uniref:Domain of unknown function at the cortex 1 domain-containing protein n=1 Tax=Chaetoceros tenuissimus TaxID=426638 RepID=A0AAD3DA70_9STRA|nr:hypothetical protein CTEN210_17160 [Chaetoceros tenuissimus]
MSPTNLIHYDEEDIESTAETCFSFLPFSFVRKACKPVKFGFCPRENSFELLEHDIDEICSNDTSLINSSSNDLHQSTDLVDLVLLPDMHDETKVSMRSQEMENVKIYRSEYKNMIMLLLTMCHTLSNHQSIQTLQYHDCFFIGIMFLFSVYSWNTNTLGRTQNVELEQTEQAPPHDFVDNDENIDESRISQCKYKPLFVRPVRGTSCPGLLPHNSLPIGSPFEIETEVFRGRALIRFAEGICENPAKQDEYFDTQNELFTQNIQRQIVIQGQFKRYIPMETVLLGGIFRKPFNIIFPPRILDFLQGVFDKFAPGIRLELGEERQAILAPILAGCHTVSIDNVGEEPDMSAPTLPENTFMSNDLKSSKERVRILGNPKTACEYKFQTHKIYTFHSIDHVIDLVNYQLHLPLGMKIDMMRPLGKQPVNFSAITKYDETIFSFDIWHEKSVQE